MPIPPLILLLGLAILAHAFTRSQRSIKPARFPHLTGWQKLFGVLAVILAVLMVINPELLALGLLGDAAFFDLLVLLLSLQLQAVAVRGGQCVLTVFARMRRVMIPRLSLSLWMLLMIFAPLADLVVAIQKAVHRITS